MNHRFCLLAVLALTIPAASAMAGSTSSHTVTVTVSAVNELSIDTSPVTLTINSGDAWGGLNQADDSSDALGWTTNETGKKITVATNLASPKYVLRAEALGISGGTAAGRVIVSTTPRDFVTGISKTSGDCTVDYTADADPSAGTGSDAHTITYTITSAS